MRTYIQHRWLILFGAVVAVCISAYPIVFFDKSYVSPGYGPQLLYSEAPFVPGYTYDENERENLSGIDIGAIFWQNLPYSGVQHEAVFEDGEFPLWNRYNSSGLPLFAQGQSQILDPLHWIVVVAQGNAWAWDVKFLTAKLVFLAGVGVSILFMTQSVMASILVMLSAAFIGIFTFKFNHPAIFVLTYAPWILLCYLNLVRALKENRNWPLFWTIGIVVSSLLQLFAGVPKEGFVLFCFVHVSGMLGVMFSTGATQKWISNLGKLIILWSIILLISTPHWLIFLDALGKMSIQDHSLPSWKSISDIRFFVDSIFFQGKTDSPASYPSINLFIFAAVLQGIFSIQRLYRNPYFWMIFIPFLASMIVAYGGIPSSIVDRLPLLKGIIHIGDTFLFSAAVFAVFLSGFGLKTYFCDCRESKNSWKWVTTTLVIGILLAIFFQSSSGRYSAEENPARVVALISITALLVFLLISQVVLTKRDKLNAGSALALFFLFGLSQAHHGFHLQTGSTIDSMLVNPKTRANFLESSQAISHLKDRLSGSDSVRVIGEGAVLFPGFNSFLQLEGLNGPDALQSQRYKELLDHMGWKLWGGVWLRLVRLEDMSRLKPLLDMLNVRYVVSKNDLDTTVHLASNFTDRHESTNLLLQEQLEQNLDRVSCKRKGSGIHPDGVPDHVFSLDLEVQAADYGPVFIPAIRLKQESPNKIYHTGGPYQVLGVSRGKTLPLLNDENGEILIPMTSRKLRLWLFVCVDAPEGIDSDYVGRAAVDITTDMNLVHEHDLKIWERKDSWPRAFFVDEVATYDRLETLVRFVAEADGTPLVAVMGTKSVWPKSRRKVVAAEKYRLTANTTSFQVDAPAAGIVVLTEVNIPGDVHVTVNGQHGKVITVNHAFRGVEIPEAGSYDIQFSYRPHLWVASWMLSGLGIIGLFLLVLLVRRNNKHIVK